MKISLGKNKLQDMFRLDFDQAEHSFLGGRQFFGAGVPGAFKSFRLRIFLLILLLSWIPIIAINELVFTELERQQIDQKVESLQYQTLTLSRQMSRNSYLFNLQDNPSLNNSLNTEINLLSDYMGGRIQVIDSNYRIVRDTYSQNTNMIIIDSRVIKIFRNGQVDKYLYRYEDNYVEFTVPIYDEGLTEVRGVLICSASTYDLVDQIESMKRTFTILAFIVCVLIMAVAFAFSTVIVKPLKTLETELNRANQGDMEPISVPGCLETERIAAVYNESLLRLKHLDESRQEFVSNVSHELKTPITSVRIMADTLMTMDGAPVELYKEFMADISTEIERESSIIDDLLEMVRLDRSNATLNVSRLNLNTLLENSLRRLKGIAEQRNILVNLECMRVVEADVDELKFTRMITNLVENAIKYNKDNGSVTVYLNADATYFYVRVTDTGVGIPEDQINQIFERFHRVDKARSRETGGTGLGLAICKSICQLHHGVIKVSSDYGEGSTFMIRIPLVYIP